MSYETGRVELLPRPVNMPLLLDLFDEHGEHRQHDHRCQREDHYVQRQKLLSRPTESRVFAPYAEDRLVSRVRAERSNGSI
jgi:hypothetical protein